MICKQETNTGGQPKDRERFNMKKEKDITEKYY